MTHFKRRKVSMVLKNEENSHSYIQICVVLIKQVIVEIKRHNFEWKMLCLITSCTNFIFPGNTIKSKEHFQLPGQHTLWTGYLVSHRTGNNWMAEYSFVCFATHCHGFFGRGAWTRMLCFIQISWWIQKLLLAILQTGRQIPNRQVKTNDSVCLYNLLDKPSLTFFVHIPFFWKMLI